MVGEIRDRATAAIAIEAALTGHKVFATFHTEDSIGSLVRLIDMNIEAFLICSTVVSSIAQRLARRICASCKAAATPSDYEMRLLLLDPAEVPQPHVLPRHGLRRVPRHGLPGPHRPLRDAAARRPDPRHGAAKRPAHEIRHHALRALGLCTLQEDGIAKALLGLTTLEEVIRQVPRSIEQRTLHEIAQTAFATS